MNSRDKILNGIRAAKTEPVAMPQSWVTQHEEGSQLERFISILTSIGGGYMEVSSAAELMKRFANQEWTITGIEGTPGFDPVAISSKKASDLEAVHTAILRGSIAVAENGAVWVSEKNLLNRCLPFICQRLVLLVDETQVVPTMHDAYHRIGAEDGYGVFIAGPSKTADIEQSLVIGAHGPVEMLVAMRKGE